MKKIQFTKDGLEKIKQELRDLQDEKRPAAVKRLATARAMGDLSENSEYVAAKEDLAFIEGRILELELVIENAIIIEQATTKTNTIDIGNTVIVDKEGKEVTYHIVGEFEADPMQNKLSHTSPLGKALLGKKIGELVKVEVPAGILTYQIKKIE